MKEAFNYISLIVCLLGLVIWMLVIRMKEPPAGLADVGKIMFGVGLGGALLGK